MKRIIITSIALLFGAVSFAQTAPVEKKKIKKQDMKEISYDVKKTKVDKKEFKKDTKNKDQAAGVSGKQEIKTEKSEIKADVKPTKKDGVHQPIRRVTTPAKH